MMPDDTVVLDDSVAEEPSLYIIDETGVPDITLVHPPLIELDDSVHALDADTTIFPYTTASDTSAILPVTPLTRKQKKRRGRKRKLDDGNVPKMKKVKKGKMKKLNSPIGKPKPKEKCVKEEIKEKSPDLVELSSSSSSESVIELSDGELEDTVIEVGVSSGTVTRDLARTDRANLRPVVIDGSNVAFGHGRNGVFSSRGLKICVDYFLKRGHEVKVFVPLFRRRNPCTQDTHILDELEKSGHLYYTPSRRVDGKLVVCYDDRFIIEYAHTTGGVIVSRDNYADVQEENSEWKKTILERLLLYTWVGDTIMFPQDPLGRRGPTLDKFLSF